MVRIQDHFRPPLSARRHWHSFHNAWATYLASDLNSRLPEGYFAEANVQFGIEIDVATFEESEGGALSSGWSPPAPVQTIPFVLATDAVEVLVYDSTAGPVLAAAMELVSPANKDRAAHRDAFVAKCETYLQGGAGLIIVDLVTDRKGNLHDELLARIAPSASRLETDLYAAAYRPVESGGQTSLEVWQQPLNVGGELPTMPLCLRGGLTLPAELAATYERTCREQRVPVPAVAT
jgi:hypothetical protein